MVIMHYISRYLAVRKAPSDDNYKVSFQSILVPTALWDDAKFMIIPDHCMTWSYNRNFYLLRLNDPSPVPETLSWA